MPLTIKQRYASVQNPIFIHFHNGKSGGSTLGQIISHNIDHVRFFAAMVEKHDRFGIWDIDEIRKKVQAVDDSKRQYIRWTGGHVPFGIHELFDRPSLYFGLIRNPSDRWLSSLFYNYARKKRKFAEGDTVATIAERIRGGIFANPQTRYFSGAKPDEIIDEGHLVQAKDNIDRHFLFVAPTERFDDMVVVVAELFGWKLYRSVYTKKNETAPHSLREQVDRKTVELIEDIHHFDCELYKFCVERFELDIRSLGGRFQLNRILYRPLNVAWKLLN